jgi:hypothetical protein
MRDDLLEFIRLLGFDFVGLLVLLELVVGLRLPDVIAERMVVLGLLMVVLPDRLPVDPRPGTRMLYLVAVLFERELRTDRPLEETPVRFEDEDLGVIVRVGVLTERDRDEVMVLEEPDLTGDVRLLADAEEDLAVRLLAALLLRPDDFSAQVGSMASIKAKINVPTTIPTFLCFFSFAIILLLKYST